MSFRERMRAVSSRNGSRVVLALDVSGSYEQRVERAVKLVDKLGDSIAGVKINQHLILPFGLHGLRELIRRCNGRDLPVIADLKLNDIESTNLEAMDIIHDMGVDGIIANPFVGYREGLGKVIERGREMGTGVVLLVYMSHRGAREGYDLRVNGRSLWTIFAERVRRWDADGAIVSAKSLSRLRRVRQRLKDDQMILSPGVGFQGGDARRAVQAGADYIIVGRSVIDSPDPSGALKKFQVSSRTP